VQKFQYSLQVKKLILGIFVLFPPRHTTYRMIKKSYTTKMMKTNKTNIEIGKIELNFHCHKNISHANNQKNSNIFSNILIFFSNVQISDIIDNYYNL
jgi:ribosomal protein S4E